MPDAEPTTLRHRLLLATGGVLAAAGTAALGLFAFRWFRQNEPGTLESSGRGLPAEPPSPQARRSGHETEDMSAALMGTLTLGLGLAIAASIGLMLVMLHRFQAARNAEPGLAVEQTTAIVVPLPHLQTAPLAQIATLAAHQQHQLDTYGWTGPDHARARIPIAVAIRRTVGQSLDATP